MLMAMSFGTKGVGSARVAESEKSEAHPEYVDAQSIAQSG